LGCCCGCQWQSLDFRSLAGATRFPWALRLTAVTEIQGESGSRCDKVHFGAETTQQVAAKGKQGMIRTQKLLGTSGFIWAEEVQQRGKSLYFAVQHRR